MIKKILKVVEPYCIKIQHAMKLEEIVNDHEILVKTILETKNDEISKAFEQGMKAQNRGISNWIDEGNKNRYSRLVGVCDCCGKFATGLEGGTCKNCI